MLRLDAGKPRRRIKIDDRLREAVWQT